MKKRFKQLGQGQRYQIGALLLAGKKKCEIAEIFGVQPNIVSPVCRAPRNC